MTMFRRPAAFARIAVLGAALAIGLAACAPPPLERPEATFTGPPLPPMKRFGPTRVDPPRRPNAEIARDIIDLSFFMESGRPLPHMTRFEGPIRVRVTGSVPPTATADLSRLLGRLRSEAGIDIAPAPAGTPAGVGTITVEFMPRARMQALVPEAACFVVPRVTSWAEYRSARRSSQVDWATLATRERAAVFIPSDTAPQEIRDCLHEEIAQALGPLNDLYRLPDSVFNDDNFHAILTGFDMLVLRAYYAPELHSGMTREAAQSVLPRVLARLNPRGGSGGPAAPDPTPREWIDAVETALGPRAAQSSRIAAARRAVAIAEAEGWTEARAGFSWFALGRLSLSGDLDTAFTAFLRAATIYRASPNLQIQAAHVDMQLAAFALSAGRAEDALTFANRSLGVVAQAENAALLSTLLLVRAEALDTLGRSGEARSVRLDALGWARYGFGSDTEVRRRAAEIAALSPVSRGRVAPVVTAVSAAGGY